MNYSTITLPSDLSLVRAVAEASFSATPDSSLDEWFSFVEMEKAIKSERGACIKAIDDAGQVVGMIYAQQENPINGKEGLDKWVIVIAAVNPGQTGGGVGTGLLKAMEDHAKQRGVSKMFVYTNKDDEKVVHFYQKNGYEDAGWIRDYQYGQGNSAVFLLKYL
jgi:ribosomal protein S18 acetylase RimI-like enzyme